MEASVYANVATMLIAFRWDIQTASDVGLTGKMDDTKWIMHARKQKRIAITFDELKAKQGERVSRELRRRGGKIVRVNGKLNDYRAVGKLLYHFPEWFPFLIENNGVAVLGEVKPKGCICYTPEEYHQHYHFTDYEVFAKEYIKKKKAKHYKLRKQRPKPPHPDQTTLID